MNFDEEWGCADNGVQYRRKLEHEQVYEFVAGLNNDLDDVRGRILRRYPLSSMREVFLEVRREENWRLMTLKDKIIGLEDA